MQAPPQELPTSPCQEVKLLTPSERRLRGQLAAHTSWANTADRSARTQPARDAFFAKLCAHVDPDGVLPEDERIRRAEYLRKALEDKFLAEAGGDPQRAESLRRAFFARLALKSA